ncbi:MAG: DivIVA domain-containing protein, partial [Actinobacteria bacterium]|nr:DivIVA domain-containing protein [Actinomycetota bacterium]
MPLSPDDIERKHFLAALRGYDREQVDAFLTEVAEDYRTLLRKLQLFAERKDGASQKLDDPLFGVGERVERVLRTAVQSAKEIRAGAEEEIVRLREEAHRGLEAVQEAFAKAAHESDMLATEAAALTKQRREVQRLLEEAAEVRAGAGREAAELRATAQREASQLREAGEREASQLR